MASNKNDLVELSVHPAHWLISTTGCYIMAIKRATLLVGAREHPPPQFSGRPGFLGPQFDAAVFHALTGAQEGLVIEYNWVLGPSFVSFARLDTAQSTQPDEAGRYTTIKHNVHMGLGMTTKGYNHTIEHNTGSRFLQVESWASIDDHNLYTVARYNAHSEVKSRGSTLEFDAIPATPRSTSVVIYASATRAITHHHRSSRGSSSP